MPIRRGDTGAPRAHAGWIGSLLVGIGIVASFAVAGPEGGDVSFEARLAHLQVLWARRASQPAMELGRELLAELDAGGRGASPEAAEILDLLVRTLRLAGEGRAPETLAFAERSLELRRALYDRGSPEAVRGATTLADVLAHRRQLDRARELAEEAVANAARIDGDGGLALADALRALGGVQLLAGEPAAARSSYGRALELFESRLGPEAPEVAELLAASAGASRAAGDLAAAQELGERAVAANARAFGAGHPAVGRALNSHAILLREVGDLAGARRCLEGALTIYESAYGPDHPWVAGLLNNLGNLTRQTGDLRAARSYLERSLAIRELTLGAGHPDVAQSLGNLALVAKEAGDVHGARSYLERALAIREQALGPDHPDVAVILMNLGEVYSQLGEPAEARRVDERALAIRIAALGPEHPLVAESLHNLALILAGLDEVEAGREMAIRALELWRRTLGPEHPRTAIATLTLARFDVLAGRIDEAVDGALRAEDLARELLWFNTRQLAEREALQLADTQQSGRHLTLTLLAAGATSTGSRQRVWEGVARSRAMVLAAASARRRLAAASADPEVAAATARLDQDRSDLASALVRAWSHPGRDGEAEVAAARARVAASERRLAAASPAFAEEVDAAQLSATEIAAALPPGAALVSIVRFLEDPVLAHRRRIEAGQSLPSGPEPARVPAYLAFVLRAGDPAPAMASLGPAATIDGLVEAWAREAARGPLLAGRGPEQAIAAYRLAGAELRRRAWAPIARHLEGADLVLMVPDGALHGVSWASLPDHGSGYLVDDGPVIHRLTAERDVLELQRGHDHGRGLLALGGVSYDAAPTAAAGRRTGDGLLRGIGGLCASLAGRRFEALPATAREVEAVADIWRRAEASSIDQRQTPRVVTLTAGHATEAAFRTGSAGRRVLHLATHGFALSGDCGEPASAGLRGIGGLAPADRAGAGTAPVAPSPPVDGAPPSAPTAAASELGVLAGLAVAGANRRELAGGDGDDGILTAEEISGLDLEGVEWVVLSACNTAGGEVRPGEGVIGLERAFRVAGAHTVIMSLWAVEDDAARAFMEALYRARFEHGRTTPMAMRDAALSLLDARRRQGLSTHPFHWAAFVATGDWS